MELLIYHVEVAKGTSKWYWPSRFKKL